MFVRIVCLLVFLSAFEARHVVVRRGSNTYGDEMIVPSGGTGSQQPANVPEQPPSVVVQPPPAEEPKVVESGYRS